MLIQLSLLKQCMLIWADVTSQWGDSCILLWVNWCFNKNYQSHTQGLFNLSVLWVWGRNKVLNLWCFNTLVCCGFHCLLQCWMSLWERRTHTRLHDSGLLLCAGVKGTVQVKETDPIWKQTSAVLKEKSSGWITGGWTTTVGQQRGSDIANGLSGFAWFCYSATSCVVWLVGGFVCGTLSISARKQTQGKTDCKMQWLLTQGKLSRHPEDPDPSSSYPKEGYAGKGISDGIQTECKLVTGTIKTGRYTLYCQDVTMLVYRLSPGLFKVTHCQASLRCQSSRMCFIRSSQRHENYKKEKKMLRHFKTGKFHPRCWDQAANILWWNWMAAGIVCLPQPASLPSVTGFLQQPLKWVFFSQSMSQNKGKNMYWEIFGTPGDLPFSCVDHWQLVILKEYAPFQNLSLNVFVIWWISAWVTLCILSDFYCLQHFIQPIQYYLPKLMKYFPHSELWAVLFWCHKIHYII